MKLNIAYLLRLLIVIILCNASLYAQITQNLRGKVVDKETQIPLPGVSVNLINYSMGTQTDLQGNFRFDKPQLGKYTLTFSMIGYNTLTLTNIELNSGKETVLNIEMIEKPYSLNEIEVKAELSKEKPINDFVMVSGRQFTNQEGNRYASGYGDAARMSMSFAGVTSSGSDQNNEIVIRGNSPKGLLWRLEGVEIPNPNHFSDGQGSTSGIIGMINSNSLANSDFLTGAFPAEYGNTMSGVFDLRLRKGNDQSFEQTFQLGLVGLDASSEGPLNKKGASYRINARYSTLELLLKLGVLNIQTEGFKPKYQDANFTFDFPTEKVGTFTFWGVAGTSISSEEEVSNKYFEKYGMGVVGLSHKVSVKKKGYFYSVIALSRESTHQNNQSFLSNIFTETFKTKYLQSNIRFSTYYNQKISDHSTLRIGLIGSQLGYNFDDNRWSNSQNVLVNLLDENDKTYLIQNYAQWKYSLTPKLIMTMGVHYSRFILNGNQAIEPRFGIRYQISERQDISIGIGKHSRLEPISIYLFKRLTQNSNEGFIKPNEGLGLSRATHYVIGYNRSISKNTHLKIEGYYQWLYDIPIDTSSNSVVSMINSTGGVTNTILTNQGLGENKGLELTLEKYFSDNYYFLITGSLFKSKYKAIDGIWRNTVFNNNYAFNALFGKDYKIGTNKVHWLVLNSRFMLRGGNRYTPIILSESIKRGGVVRDFTQYLTNKYSDYWRIDLGIGYRINRKKATWTVSADIQNVTNHKNIIQDFYDNSTKSTGYVYALPIIPILNFKVDF